MTEAHTTKAPVEATCLPCEAGYHCFKVPEGQVCSCLCHGHVRRAKHPEWGKKLKMEEFPDCQQHERFTASKFVLLAVVVVVAYLACVGLLYVVDHV